MVRPARLSPFGVPSLCTGDRYPRGRVMEHCLCPVIFILFGATSLSVLPTVLHLNLPYCSLS